MIKLPLDTTNVDTLRKQLQFIGEDLPVINERGKWFAVRGYCLSKRTISSLIDELMCYGCIR